MGRVGVVCSMCVGVGAEMTEFVRNARFNVAAMLCTANNDEAAQTDVLGRTLVCVVMR